MISNELTYCVNSASPSFDNRPSTFQLRTRRHLGPTHGLFCCVQRYVDWAARAVSSGVARPPIHSLSLRETEASRQWCWFLWNIVSIRPCVCRPSEAICLSLLLPMCICSLVLGRRPPAGTDENSASPSSCKNASVSPR